MAEQSKSYPTTTTQARGGVAHGWQRVEDERGAAQYLPVPQRAQRPLPYVEVLPPERRSQLPVQTVQEVHTSHEDRAKGFNRTTIPLAGVAGVVALLAALSLFGVPWLSWSALLILFATFAVVWLVAYTWFSLASPDGTTVMSILLSYRFQRHEQRARLDRLAAWEEEQYGNE